MNLPRDSIGVTSARRLGKRLVTEALRLLKTRGRLPGPCRRRSAPVPLDIRDRSASTIRPAPQARTPSAAESHPISMHATVSLEGLGKREAYREICRQLEGLVDGEPSGMANCANLSALLFQSLPRLNWAGFYFLRDGGLVLGPFQGRVACVRIAVGKGVCGTAARDRKAIIVPDVSRFPGHIACDPASRSEIVIPLEKDGRLLGVLDLDSPDIGRFDAEDRDGLGAAAAILLLASDFGGLAD